MERELLQEQLLEFQPKTLFTIISKGRVVSVGFDEITHVSKHGNETVIYTATDNNRTKHSLKDILNDLPVNDFFRIHKSHIFSVRYMNGVKKRRIRVGEYYLPVSDYYKSQLLSGIKRILDRGYNDVCLEK